MGASGLFHDASDRNVTVKAWTLVQKFRNSVLPGVSFDSQIGDANNLRHLRGSDATTA
jgi:hypothetical protein